MSERFSTAGMSLQYAVETTAGVRPTTGYLEVPEIKSMPGNNSAPGTIESTTFKETESKTYVPALKDPGGALGYKANLTQDLVTFWDALMEAYETASASGKAVWFAVVYPKLDKAVYYSGVPAPLLPDDAEVGGMAETTLYITPSSPAVMEAKPSV